MLRVTRPCLLEHCLSATIINRMMKGIMVGTFGQTTPEIGGARGSGGGFVVAAAALNETNGGGGGGGEKRSRMDSSVENRRHGGEKQEQHDVTVKMNTASELLSSPTWAQAAKPLLTLQAYEEQFLPQMEGWREVQAKNRAMEIGALNRACKSWQTTILYVIFTRWHDALVGAKAAQERFIIFITRLR